ncbi:MAG: hypothetical protein JJT93_01470 [Gammaproteobacteria bacterium]|nr:hypothetical protein [Gammaproteobacteria bacterium]TVQ49104.1 MAG: hypothetical protein EA371_04050 [Gammaproteobacteria bacterium]
MSKHEERAEPATGEPAFLPHPMLDRLLDISVALAAEVWAERDRRETLERVLTARGQLDAQEIEAYLPDEAERSARKAERDAFVKRIFAGLKTLD